MKYQNLKFGLLWLMLFPFIGLKGQDPQFSQFFNSSLYYNPATVGLSRDLRISSSYRKLWNRIPGDFSTYFLSVDYQWTERNMGIGFLMFSDNEGNQRLRTRRAELIYSYRIQNTYRMLQFGLTVFSINIRDLKGDGLVFTDQLDPIHGVINPSSFVYNSVEPVVFPDWNFGVVYRQNSRKHRLTPTIGLSASHVFRPNISLINNGMRMPVKYVVNGSLITQFAINNSNVWTRKIVHVIPGFVYENQYPFQTYTIGSSFDVYPFRLGVWFRNENVLFDKIRKINAIIIHAGLVIPVSLSHDLIVDYSYDSTVSKLEFKSGGAHEISLIYNISLPEKKRSVPCFNEWWRYSKKFSTATK